MCGSLPWISLEKLKLRTRGGKAKIVGTIIGIGGAMILTLVKGMEMKIGSSDLNLLHHQNENGAHPHASSSSGGKTVLGSLCALASSISYALWLIIQVSVSLSNYVTYFSTLWFN